MTNIVVCCDGTWDTADQRDQGLPCPTNVFQIYNSTADTDANGDPQKKYYHPGVGTEGSKLQKIVDGAFGEGLENNIKSAYKWLCDHYRPGDNIYIFGFSRGAYTARYVAGIIATIGLANFSATLNEKQKWQRVDSVIEEFRKPANEQVLPSFAFYNSPTDVPTLGATKIRFLGVWDTVGALGIPSDLPVLRSLDVLKAHRFKDTELSLNVLCARHAVAMDEQRKNFTPTLWSNVDKHPDAKQIWFAGVHSDVGGGYPQSGLSDIALDWMAKEANACDLAFNSELLTQIKPDPRGVLHDSDTGVFMPLPTLPRPVPIVVKGSSAFHEMVIERQRCAPIETPCYWPTKTLLKAGDATGPLYIFARQHWNATGLFLEQNVAYCFQAEGEWIDGKIPFDADGNIQDHTFHLHELIHFALDESAKIAANLTGGLEKDPWWGKRVGEAPWFALIGSIANGSGTDPTGAPVPHETFVIGKGVTYTPKNGGGYLYCYANDAWGAYGNNHGSLQLKVTRT
jgi:Uncharacterized alpha/beta hydrolase domain (DUF2235)